MPCGWFHSGISRYADKLMYLYVPVQGSDPRSYLGLLASSCTVTMASTRAVTLHFLVHGHLDMYSDKGEGILDMCS